jgi:hypothetical protein
MREVAAGEGARRINPRLAEYSRADHGQEGASPIPDRRMRRREIATRCNFHAITIFHDTRANRDNGYSWRTSAFLTGSTRYRLPGSMAS